MITLTHLYEVECYQGPRGCFRLRTTDPDHAWRTLRKWARYALEASGSSLLQLTIDGTPLVQQTITDREILQITAREYQQRLQNGEWRT